MTEFHVALRFYNLVHIRFYLTEKILLTEDNCNFMTLETRAITCQPLHTPAIKNIFYNCSTFASI